MISPLKLVSPEPEKRTVAMNRQAGRPPNRELRTREHLTPSEVERLIEAAKNNRQGHRDATMILLAYRHGLRASELVDLRWDQVGLVEGVLHVRRVKNRHASDASAYGARTPGIAQTSARERRQSLRVRERARRTVQRLRFPPNG
jgi:integrase